MPGSENASDVAALSAAAEELYAMPAEDFVSARTDRVRQLRKEGQRDLAAAVAGLPKPTVAAWLLNQLARQRPDATRQLVELGDELREAQRTLDGPDLRALTRQRQAVVAAYVRQVRALAEEMGRPVSADVALQVEETLRAAVADAAAGEALLSGRLTTGLSYAGLGEVDVSAAVAAPRSTAARTPRQDSPNARRKKQGGRPDPADDELAAARRRRADEAQQVLAAAEVALAEAETERAAAERAAEDLATRSENARNQVAAVRAELDRVEEAAAELAQLLKDAEHRREKATHAVAAAEQVVQTVRTELDGTP